MDTEIEYVNYKDFVAGLETTENPGVDDVTVVSNETDGPRTVPANTSALSTVATASDVAAGNAVELQTSERKKKLDIGLLMTVMAQNFLANNLARPWTVREENDPWRMGQSCIKDGHHYVFLADHYGEWDSSVVAEIDADSLFRSLADTTIDSLRNSDDYVVIKSVLGDRRLNANEIKYSSEAAFDKLDFDLNNLNDGGFVNKLDGSIVASEAFAYSEYIETRGLNGALVRSDVVDYSAVAFYDGLKRFIGSFDNDDCENLDYSLNLATRYIPLPEDTAFIRFGCRKTYVGNGVYVMLPKINDTLSATEKILKHSVHKSSFSSGYYRNTGIVQSSSTYIHSGLLSVAQSSILILKSYVDNIRAIAWFDKFGNFISATNDENSGLRYRAIAVPDKAVYFGCNLVDADPDNLFYYCYVSPKGVVESSVASDLLAKSEMSFSAEDFTDGKYVDGRNGIEYEFTNFKCSNFVDLVDVAVDSKLVMSSLIADLAGVAFYDSDKNFLSGIVGADLSGLGFLGNAGNVQFADRLIDVPNWARYVRFNMRKSDSASNAKIVYLKSKDARLPEEELPEEPILTPYEELIHACLCVGDSLTAGADYASGEYTGEMPTNYPYYLSKITNVLVAPADTAAKSGDSASNCWARWFENDAVDVTDYDAFIIWLGTNNGLTDTLDTDVVPYDDYSEYALTETGYYCKILSKIISLNSTAKIFLGTVFASKDNVQTTNNVINKIAALQRYANNVVGVVDNSDRNFGKPQSVVHPNNAVHFGKVGNLLLATHWRDGIRKCIDSNLSLMEYPRIV